MAPRPSDVKAVAELLREGQLSLFVEWECASHPERHLYPHPRLEMRADGTPAI